MKKRGTPRTRRTDREIDKFGNPVLGLSDTQLRLLGVFVKQGAGSLDTALTLGQLQKKAVLSEALCRRGLGAVNPESREWSDNLAGYKSLLTRNVVVVVWLDDHTVYHLTPYGVTVVEQVREAISALGPPRPSGY